MLTILYNTAYIEIGKENHDIFFGTIFFLFFVSMIIVAYRFNKRSLIDDNSSDANLPINLFGACTSKFLTETKHSFDEIKDKYSEFILRFAFRFKAEIK